MHASELRSTWWWTALSETPASPFWFVCRKKFSVQLHDMSATTTYSMVPRIMSFDRLFPMVSHTFFGFEVDWIAKGLIVVYSQLHSDAFRMPCGTAMEIVN
jgi:hypothetical protein